MPKKEKKKFLVHWPQQHDYSEGQLYSSEPRTTRGRVTSLFNTNISAKEINAYVFTDTQLGKTPKLRELIQKLNINKKSLSRILNIKLDSKWDYILQWYNLLL